MIKLWSRRRELRAEAVAKKMADEETERRVWCIEQAVFMEDVNNANLIGRAEMIYEYVYGARGGK
jgi:hypothetical protein